MIRTEKLTENELVTSLISKGDRLLARRTIVRCGFKSRTDKLSTIFADFVSRQPEFVNWLHADKIISSQLNEPVARSCWDPECDGCFGCHPEVLEEFHGQET